MLLERMRPVVPETEVAPHTIEVIDEIVAQRAILAQAWRDDSPEHPAMDAKKRYEAFVASKLDGKKIRFTGSYETVEVTVNGEGTIVRNARFVKVENQEAIVNTTKVSDGDDPEMFLRLAGTPEKIASINVFRTQALEIFPEV